MKDGTQSGVGDKSPFMENQVCARVAFTTSDVGFVSMGGAEVQLLKTREYILARGGIAVSLYDKWRERITDFDALHIFGLDVSNYPLVRVAKRNGVPIIISPIYWPATYFLWKNRQITKLGYVGIVRLLRWVYPLPFDYAKRMLDAADLVLPNSEIEKTLVARHFAVPKEKIAVVPNAADPRFFHATPDLFTKTFKLRDFVLFVGRIEPRKNVLKLIKAMQYVDADLVIIGEASDAYGAKCIAASTDRVHYIGRLEPDSPMLASAYAAARCFVLPSWFETPGLAALEAGLAGANVVVTSRGSTKEYFKSFVEYVDPGWPPKRMAQAIIRSLTRPKNEELRLHILTNYTWEIVAGRLTTLYKNLLKGRRCGHHED